MSSLLQHAKSELRRAGLYDEDADFNGDIAVQVEALVQTFVAYGHSGGSAALTLAAFNRVIANKPITPLTGEDDEWEDMTRYQPGNPIWQNKRCPSVFKNDKGSAWILLDGGSTAKGAHVGDGKVKYITFPYSVE